MAMSEDLPSGSSPRYDLVDLFAGPGGLDVAAHWLGINTIGIEWDDGAVATRNAAGLRTKQGDVAEVSDKDHAPPPGTTIRILAGGPPCQTYTVAGTGVGRQRIDTIISLVNDMVDQENIDEALWQLKAETGDERTGLVLEPLRLALEAIRDANPYDAIVLEQVPQVLPIWKKVTEALKHLGYQADCKILHTEDFGVPQTRRRAILIARRGGPALFPTATHRRYRKGTPRSEGAEKQLPWRTMGEALRSTRGRSTFEVVSNYGTGGNPKLRGRRTSDQPSATVTGKISRNRLVDPQTGWDLGPDPETGRDLSRFDDNEAGILQSFPPGYPWNGRDRAQQIGNAIPPRLAVHVLAAALGMSVEVSEVDAAVATPWQPPSDECSNCDDPTETHHDEQSQTFGIIRLNSPTPGE